MWSVTVWYKGIYRDVESVLLYYKWEMYIIIIIISSSSSSSGSSSSSSSTIIKGR